MTGHGRESQLCLCSRIGYEFIMPRHATEIDEYHLFHG
jgi:hypothetical protein